MSIKSITRFEKPIPLRHVLSYVQNVWGISPIKFINYSVLFMWNFVKVFGKEKFEEIVNYIDTVKDSEKILYAFYTILATKFSNTVLNESVNVIADDITSIKDKVQKISEDVEKLLEKVEELSGYMDLLMSLDQKISSTLQKIEKKFEQNH